MKSVTVMALAYCLGMTMLPAHAADRSKARETLKKPSANQKIDVLIRQQAALLAMLEDQQKQIQQFSARLDAHRAVVHSPSGQYSYP